MPAQLMSSGAWIVPLAVFGAIMFGAWALLSILADRDERPLERLKKLTPGGQSELNDGPVALRQSNRMQELLELAAPTLSKPLMPTNAGEQSKLKMTLSTAGFRTESAVPIFLGVKLLLTLVGFGLGAAVSGHMNGMTLKMWCAAFVAGGSGFFLPDMFLNWKRKKRHDEIFYALPDALDLMVVCVEAGLGLDAAMRRVSQEMRRNAATLTQEFELSNLQLQMGRPRREVLHDLGVRNGVDDLRSLVAILIQADRFGSSIGQALRVQSDSMRVRRRQLAEERAQKTAVKLLIPLILFIFPGIFVILVGPAGIMIAHNLGTATGGG
jgi:tight adherence protein C